MLDGLRSRPRYVAHLGCLEGCLAYLGAEITPAWLYGGTGHAFIANVAEGLCPSGPTAWNTEMLFSLAPNLGYTCWGLSVWRGAAGATFPTRQREAWDLVRAAIDRGTPCYGWQFEAPEHYVITGYDSVGYYYSGDARPPRGPLPWQRLGTWDVDLLEVYAVKQCAPASEAHAVRGALRMALRHAAGPAEWIYPQYRSGPAAFERWADELAAGRARYDGHAFNAQVWHECRTMAVAFLAEARDRLPRRMAAAIGNASAAYAASRDRLAELLAFHPPRAPGREDWVEPLLSPAGADLMRSCAVSERDGLAGLEEILSEL